MCKNVQNLELREKVHSGMRFELGNVLDMISWIGEDFYALTNGDPVGIEGNLIKVNKADADQRTPVYPGMTHPTLIVKNTAVNQLLVITEGDWLIKEPGMGYQVFSDEVVRARYMLPETPSEEG